LEHTPKALANFSPGLERSDNPGYKPKIATNPEKGSALGEPLQGCKARLIDDPRVVAALQPWAEISQRLRRIYSSYGGGTMPLPVKLQDVVDALEAAAESSMHFLDKRTGEIVMLTDEEWKAAEEDELISDYPDWQRDAILKAREVQASEHFIELPGQSDINEYELMERFADEYKDQRTSAELLRSIKGKGAFRRFKDTISDLGLWAEWNEFRAKEFEGIATEWLDDEGIPYTREDIAEPNSEISM
jgi:hypothetical protein